MADISFEDFLKGEWKGEKLKDFATKDDWENYNTTMAGKSSEAGKKATAEAHGLKYETTTKDNGKKTRQIYDTGIDYTPPIVKETPAPEERPEYEGPEYYDPRTFDPTPSYMTLREVQDDEFVENRIASMLDKGSPLFRQAAEAMARRYGTRGPRAQEAIMEALFKVAQPIAMADALMLERDRTLHNTAYYRQMDIRMQGAIQQALSHIAGGYQIQATVINDITNQWKAQLSADIQTYGIDVGAAVSTYATKVQEALGWSGLDVKMAEVLAGIEDNAEATAFLWDMVYGDNALNPSEWITKFKEKWGIDDDDGKTETTTTGSSRAQFEASIKTRLGNSNCESARVLAISIGGGKDTHWATEVYNANRMGAGPNGEDCPII